MKMPRFSMIVWAGAIMTTLFLIGGPLAQNEWARRTWRQVPCRLSSLHYEFMFGEQKITATRKNFWEPRIKYHSGAVVPMEETNDTCWVNPSDPEDSVLRLDTTTN